METKFKTALNEVMLDKYIRKSAKFGINYVNKPFDHPSTQASLEFGGFANSGKVKTDSFKLKDVTIHIYTTYNGPTEMDVVAVNNSTGKVCFSLLLNKKGASFHVTAVKSQKCPLPAQKIYAAVIKKYDWIIVTDHQSYGGMKLWQRLSKEPGIEVYGYNPNTKQKYINTSRGLIDPYDTHYDVTQVKNNKRTGTIVDPGDLSVLNIELVACKKR